MVKAGAGKLNKGNKIDNIAFPTLKDIFVTYVTEQLMIKNIIQFFLSIDCYLVKRTRSNCLSREQAHSGGHTDEMTRRIVVGKDTRAEAGKVHKGNKIDDKAFQILEERTEFVTLITENVNLKLINKNLIQFFLITD